MTNTDQPTPAQAREHLKTFCEHTMPGAEYADFANGRVYFNKMTDEQAVKVAVSLMEIEAEAMKGMRPQ